MSFFKKGKYKLGGNSSKSKETEPVTTKEHFYKTDGASTSRNGNGSHIKETSQQHESVPADEDASFQISNKTSFIWKQNDEAIQDIFPVVLSPNEIELIKVGKLESEVTVIYFAEVESNEEDTKTYQFQLKLVCADGENELNVDWMNAAELQGIQFKPDLSNCSQPIKLIKNETLIELNAT